MADAARSHQGLAGLRALGLRGMEMVAEGVEDASVQDALTEWDCDLAQGYRIARPVSADLLTAWLIAHTTARSAATAATG